ncbi:hypothetical protein, variant 2 [Aphanomyces astaci]|uniref:Uncharacterized protein n=1 Tax=Aphanomyces astaci TaxID=112090 RepID=W4FPJ2_APHAT|nr:hypothetical protein, variant 2 [Aphanomyces astaci]ETV68568.1 hypothetical protein, variant 2 [Aphanomyces astaci]|eukprot:XP_009841995.1 hypothetical protein, variant 2 [Aphanomyces astaci]
MSLQPIQSPSRPSALSNFAAQNNNTTTPPLSNLKPTELNSLRAATPKHELTSPTQSKPQTSASASFAKLEPPSNSLMPKHSTALSSFAAHEAAATSHKPPATSSSALSSFAASEGLAPLKKISALASFAAHDTTLVPSTLPTSSLKSPLGKYGRPLGSIGLNVDIPVEAKEHEQNEVEIDDNCDAKSIEKALPTKVEAKGVRSASRHSRVSRSDFPKEHTRHSSSSDDNDDDDTSDVKESETSDDEPKGTRVASKASMYDDKEIAAAHDHKESSQNGKPRQRRPPPLAFTAKFSIHEPILHAIVKEDVTELKQFLASSSLAHLGTIRDDMNRTVMQYAVGLGNQDICTVVLGYPQTCGCAPASPLKHHDTSPRRRQRPSSPSKPHCSPKSPNSHDTAAGLAILLFGLLEPVDCHRRNVLHYMCHSKNPHVSQFIHDHPCIVRCIRKHIGHFDVQDDFGMYPLSYAALNGHRSSISECFQLGCGTDYDEADVAAILDAAAPDTSLRRALLDGFELVDRQRKASPKRPDQCAVSIQPRMEYFGQTDINLSSGSVLQTSLHKIAQFGCVDALDYALSHNADVNAVDANGWTALHYCAANLDHEEATAAIASALLACDTVDLNVPSMQGRTPLHIAASAGRDDVLQLLLLHGANLNAVDDHGMTPLHASALAGHVSVAHSLLVATLDATSLGSNDSKIAITLHHRRTCTKENALHIAARAGHIHMVRLLCAWDVEGRDWSREKDCHGHTPIQVAKNSVTREAFTNVWQAAWDGHPDKLQACLHDRRSRLDDDLAPTPRSHKTLLHLAVMGFAREGAATTKKLGHSRSLDANVEARYGQTIRLARQALEASGQSPSAGDDVGVTPLMLAAACGSVLLAQELVAQSSNDSVGATDGRGNTALHYAYAYCHGPMARWIERQDADQAVS